MQTRYFLPGRPAPVRSNAEPVAPVRRAGALAVVGALMAGAVTALTPASSASAADIYKFVDSRGVMHFTDRPKGRGWKLVYRGGSRVKKPAAPSGGFSLNRNRFTPLINSMAQRFGLNHSLLHAVIQAESSYNPNALSKKGAVGLMQLMPGTAERYGVKDRYNPRENVAGGTRYLRDLLTQFRDVELALAAYNAGENAVIKYGRKIPPYPETQTYVRRVLRFYHENRPPS